jgi:hypothetical protein
MTTRGKGSCMAKKQSVPKASSQSSTRKVSTKNVVARKSKALKPTTASSIKHSGAATKKGKTVKATSQPKVKRTTALKKTGGSAKKAVSSKPSTRQSVATKKQGLVSQAKKGVAKRKSVPGTNPGRTAASSPPRSAGIKAGVASLTSIERYNLGGLLACAIERVSDHGSKRLGAILRRLGLSSQERENLIRLTEGFMIPKLFAEGVAEQKVDQGLQEVMTFAMAEGNYEKHWRDEIRLVGRWLGVFPEQVDRVEQQLLAKR